MCVYQREMKTEKQDKLLPLGVSRLCLLVPAWIVLPRVNKVPNITISRDKVFEISSIQVGMCTPVVIVNVLLRQPYYPVFMYATVCHIEDTLLQEITWPSGFHILSSTTFFMFLSLGCRSCVVGILRLPPQDQLFSVF